MSTLRHIAIHVEEPEPGLFAWVLTERVRVGDGDGWRALSQADAAVGSYAQAMAGGLVALQSMVQDLQRGPRQADAAGSEVDAPREPHRASAERRPAGSKSHFGFGPAR